MFLGGYLSQTCPKFKSMLSERSILLVSFKIGEFVLRSATVVAGLSSTGRYATSRARSQKWSRNLVNTGFRDFFMRWRQMN